MSGQKERKPRNKKQMPGITPAPTEVPPDPPNQPTSEERILGPLTEVPSDPPSLPKPKSKKEKKKPILNEKKQGKEKKDG